jgi:hypothetical protein
VTRGWSGHVPGTLTPTNQSDPRHARRAAPRRYRDAVWRLGWCWTGDRVAMKRHSPVSSMGRSDVGSVPATGHSVGKYERRFIGRSRGSPTGIGASAKRFCRTPTITSASASPSSGMRTADARSERLQTVALMSGLNVQLIAHCLANLRVSISKPLPPSSLCSRRLVIPYADAATILSVGYTDPGHHTA